MKTIWLRALIGILIIISMIKVEYHDIFAASKNGEFALKGVGYNSCRDFTTAYAKRTNEYFRFIGWLEGYLSAYNRFVPETINIAPWQSTELLAYFLNAYCQKHPLTPYVVAIDRMITELIPYRLKESSDIVEITNGGHKVTIYREILKLVQKKLKEKKLFKGKIDGILMMF